MARKNLEIGKAAVERSRYGVLFLVYTMYSGSCFYIKKNLEEKELWQECFPIFYLDLLL